LQSSIAIKNGQSISNGDPSKTISIQYFVDCDINNNGCLGGLQYRLFMSAKETGFFQTADYYYTSYMNRKMTCQASSVASKRKYYTSLLGGAGYFQVSANNIILLLQ